MLKHKIANTTGMPSFLNWWHRYDPLIVSYHAIHEGIDGRDRYPETFVSLKSFEAQIEYMRRNYRVLNPDDFVSIMADRRPFPPKSALITFDDGYESFPRLAAKILDAHSLCAVVFLATDYIENRKPFWFDLVWFLLQYEEENHLFEKLRDVGLASPGRTSGDAMHDCLRTLKRMPPGGRAAIIDRMANVFKRGYDVFQSKGFACMGMLPEEVSSLSRSGTQFGGHTHSHTVLSVLSMEAACEEVRKNKEALERLTGKRSHLFAYPNGQEGDFGAEHKLLLAELGYVAGFSLTQRRSPAFLDPYAISRFNISREDDRSSLLFRFSGSSVLARTLVLPRSSLVLI
jgi:peptidoglycan/xylan/chitin deacetylase (PgdA/CDA1 family)